MSMRLPEFDTAPFRLSGLVVTSLLNHRPQWTALGSAAEAPPYKGAAQAPVLAIKPRNTLAGAGAAIVVPDEADGVIVGATLGIVIGRAACRVLAEQAVDFIAGYVLINDLQLPQPSHYRPAVRFKARDGYCIVSDRVVPAAAVPQPDALSVRVHIDGQLAQQTDTAERVRKVAQLLAEVSAFMTLQAGDVLTLGVSEGAPLARPGQQVEIEIAGLGTLANPVVGAADEAPNEATGSSVPTPRRAGRPSGRVAVAGAIHSAHPHPQGVQLADGRVLAEDSVTWLPPFEVGTVIALGLNYADHVKELAKELTVTAKDEPLVFFKSAGAVIGHLGHTRRPAGVKFMHYECELAVVIGKTARSVSRADAMAHVAGYTVCNDYAIRDYLENWYRPNLRVKNRDGGTVLGPWLIDAADVPDPHALTLRTWVNGHLKQEGRTANMVNDIPALIEYLSSFMTLRAGDVILTGTPDGVVNVDEGDEVVTEIDGIGRLLNTLVGDDIFRI